MTDSGNPGGGLARPGWAGRVVRLVLGIVLAWWVVEMVRFPESWTTGQPPALWAWLGIGAMVWAQESFFHIGLNRRWKHRPQMVWGIVLLSALVWDAVTGEGGWSSLAGWWVFVTTLPMAAILSGSFLLAALRAVPG